MLTRIDIQVALEKAIGEDATLAVIHSSLFEISGLDNLSKWEYLAALQKLSDQGLTIALPTFTFEFCQGEVFDTYETKSNTGILGMWLLELEESRRTPHPIYSFSVLGQLSDQIIESQSTSCFGNDSQFAVFEKLHARLVMMGCNWKCCSQFHRYEEEVKVPYRTFKTFTGMANYGNGLAPTEAIMFVRDKNINASYDVNRAIEPMWSRELVRSVPLGVGKVESVSCDSFAESCRSLLRDDPLYFVEERPKVAHLIRQSAEISQLPHLNIAVLGNANISFLTKVLAAQAKKIIENRVVNVYEPPFGQAKKQLSFTNSELYAFKANVVFFTDRLEDVLGIDRLEEVSDPVRALERVVEYSLEIETFTEKGTELVVVNLFSCFRPAQLGSQEWVYETHENTLVLQANKILEERLRALKPVHLFDVIGAASRFIGGAVFDPRLWYVGRFGYSAEFSQYLAERYSAILVAHLGIGIRLLVVDLDNTLWGGVLGEVGVSGLSLGGDYPGNAFLAFQRVLKHLNERGIALAICSKNDEAHALEAINKLPNMLLAENDFAGIRINWQPKWENILELSEELNLGLEHIGFVDDNPVERDFVRRQLPAVQILELPDDPSMFGDTLLLSPFLSVFSLTHEDQLRATNYRARQKIEKSRQSYKDIESFYASLKSVISIYPLSDTNINRVTQLVSKTNQFNTTIRRHSTEDLHKLNASDKTGVFAIGLEDRYSENEIIGVVALRGNVPISGQVEIDTFLLSCRVLGRGLEAGIIYWMTCVSRDWGMETLNGSIVPSERNTPVRSVYQEYGFTQFDDTTWLYNLRGEAKSCPAWIELKVCIDA
jgi:FkbH-like protein